jgi:hypothetical protein
MPIKDQELWNRIWAYRFPAEGPIGALRRSVRTDSSRQFQVEDSLKEYRRFTYLLATESTDLRPPPIVAAIWFGHSNDRNTDYPRFEREVIGRQLPHPLTGKFVPEAREYLLAKQRYEDAFDVAPNRKIWPDRGMYAKRNRCRVAALLIFVLAIAIGVFDIISAPVTGAIQVFLIMVMVVVWGIGSYAGPWNVGWPPPDHSSSREDTVLNLADGEDYRKGLG